MATSRRHQAHDQLLARVRLTKRRVERLNERLDDLDLDPDARETFGEQIADLNQRCGELKTEIASWEEVEIGVTTSVADLAAAVDALEADLDAVAPTDAPGYEVAVDRQVSTWTMRMDRLRLQAALGAMEAHDDLEKLTDRLDRVRGDVLIELQNALEDSKDLVVDLRNDVEDVLVDVRRVVKKVVADLTAR